MPERLDHSLNIACCASRNKLHNIVFYGHADHDTWNHGSEPFLQFGYEPSEIFRSVASCLHQHNSYRAAVQVLLMRNALISGDEYVE